MRTRRSMLALPTAGCIATVLLLGLGGCAGGASGVTASVRTPTATTAAPVSADTPTPNAEVATTANPASIGQEVIETAGDGTLNVSATLVSVKTSGPGQYSTPPSGTTYVIATVTLRNGGSGTYDYNALDFGLRDSNGNITDLQYASDVLPDMMSYGTLSAGGTVTGKLLFAWPTGDHGAELVWQPTYSAAKDQVAWKLGL